MFQVRIHWRGGRGVVTAAAPLSVAAFDEGSRAQAFPTFVLEHAQHLVLLGRAAPYKGCGMGVAECPAGAIELVPEAI